MRSFYLKSLVCMALLLAMRSEDLLSAQEKAPVPVTLLVVDPSGASIPYAQIQMIPSPQSTSEPLETDAKGRAVVNLKPGGYCIAITSQGFVKLEDHFEVSGPKIISFKLAVGGCTECIDVIPTTADSLLLRVVPSHGIKPVVLTLASLKSLPHKTVTVHNPHANADENYSGVELIDLLVSLGVPHGKDLHGKALAEYVVATGSDGYKAVLALAEVDPEFHPGEVIVADTMDGKPLDAKTGPFRLVVTEDKRPARSVHSLVSIEVKQAE
jgi:hypothetical protein